MQQREVNANRFQRKTRTGFIHVLAQLRKRLFEYRVDVYLFINIVRLTFEKGLLADQRLLPRFPAIVIISGGRTRSEALAFAERSNSREPLLSRLNWTENSSGRSPSLTIAAGFFGLRCSARRRVQRKRRVARRSKFHRDPPYAQERFNAALHARIS